MASVRAKYAGEEAIRALALTVDSFDQGSVRRSIQAFKG
jgi:hypothetical protein